MSGQEVTKGLTIGNLTRWRNCKPANGFPYFKGLLTAARIKIRRFEKMVLLLFPYVILYFAHVPVHAHTKRLLYVYKIIHFL